MLGGMGSLLGGAASLAKLSDERLKLDMIPVGQIGKTPLYSYKFPWSEEREVGVSAQEAYTHYPSAVTPGGDNPWVDPWTVNYAALLGAAAKG